MKTRVLTGITTTGTPHLGNYVGAIRPAVEASLRDDVDAFYFLADMHALVKCDDPRRVARSRLEIAATWIACGLDPEKNTFYRQSDIVEIPELTWMLSCVAAKGLLNRAHAYKASVDANRANGEDDDAGITMGLFCYPVLMAADILVFNAHKVPVGRDQVQHIEMARDMAQRFNHLYGEHFVLPEAQIDAATALLPGLDGRKMSKSYDNTIPLWSEPAELKRLIFQIKTNSLEPGEAKDPDDSALFLIWQAFASPDETAEMRAAYAAGIGWGEVKQRLFAKVDATLAPMRARYHELMARSDVLEQILQAGALKARTLSTPFIHRLRDAIGLGSVQQKAAPAASGKRGKGGRFVQYKDAQGFGVKLVAADGAVLLQAQGLADPKQAATVIQAIRDLYHDASALREQDARLALQSSVGLALSPDALPPDAVAAARERVLAEVKALAEAA